MTREWRQLIKHKFSSLPFLVFFILLMLPFLFQLFTHRFSETSETAFWQQQLIHGREVEAGLSGVSMQERDLLYLTERNMLVSHWLEADELLDKENMLAIEERIITQDLLYTGALHIDPRSAQVLRQRQVELAYLLAHPEVRPVNDSFLAASALSFFITWVQNMPSVIILCIFSLGFTFIFGQEKRTGTIHFLNIIPMHPIRKGLNKFCCGWLYMIGSFCMVVLAFLGIGTLFTGFGHLHYPVIIYRGPLQVFAVETSRYLFYIFMYLLCIVTFLSLISFTTSLFVRKSWKQLIFLAAIIVLIKEPFLGSDSAGHWHILSPFSDMNNSRLMTALTAAPFNFSVWAPIYILMLINGFLLLQALWLIHKRQRM